MTVQVSFARGSSVRVPAGTSLLDAVRGAGLPIARACGGSGLCGRCGLEILRSAGTLSAESSEEAAAKRRNRVDPRLRLACCLRLNADLSVSAPYW